MSHHIGLCLLTGFLAPGLLPVTFTPPPHTNDSLILNQKYEHATPWFETVLWLLMDEDQPSVCGTKGSSWYGIPPQACASDLAHWIPIILTTGTTPMDFGGMPLYAYSVLYTLPCDIPASWELVLLLQSLPNILKMAQPTLLNRFPLSPVHFSKDHTVS